MSHLADLALAARLASRELRGALRSFIVFMLCLALGVAAIAAVGNVNNSVGTALERDARVLLGGDLELQQPNRPLRSTEILPLLPRGTRTSEIARTNTIVTAAPDHSVVVEVKGVDAAWPLYGAPVLDPPLPIDQALAGDSVVAEPALLSRLGIGVGDRVRLGDLEVEVRSRLVREPDRLGGFVNLGPRVIARTDLLARAGVLREGALARFEVRAALPPGTDGDALAARLNTEHPEAAWRARGAADVQPQVARFTDRLATFLTLAGLTALLTGGLGIALAVRAYLDKRRTSIAVLKSLGATSAQIFAAYLLQVMLLAGLGVGLGLALGQLLPLLVRFAPAGLIPVDLHYGVYPGPLLLATACGLTASFVFALWPLALAREISPAGLFRALVAPERRLPRRRYLVMLGAGACMLAGLAIIGVARTDLALWFVGVTLVSILLLALLTRGVVALAAAFSGHGPYPVRLAVAALHRPGSGAPAVIVALGAGLAVLTAIALLWSNLARELEVRLPQRAPSTILIDIQPGQRDALARAVEETGGAVLQAMPSLRARVVRIAGLPAGEVEVAQEVRWTLRRDRGLTYMAERPADLALVAGEWWPEAYRGPPLVSIDSGVARGYGVEVGDTLTFNILGRPIEAEIANLREEVDWSSGRIDFLFIMSPGLLEAAPHTLAATVAAAPEAEAALLSRLARELPNITPISIREVVARVAESLRRIGLAIQIVAAVTLGAGVLVLAGAVAAARERHRYETVVLKVLGARRRQLLTALLVEYALIGAAAVAVGGLIGTLGAWIVVRFVMDLAWILPSAVPLTVAAVALGLTVAVSAAGLWRLLGQPAAPVLRAP